MYMGGVSLKDILYVPDEVYPSIKNYTISSNDLFISVAETLGLVGEIPIELDGANLTENADKLTNIKINKKYLLYFMMSDLIQNNVKEVSTNNAQPKLALTRIKDFVVYCPENNEQEAIAEILSIADKELDLLQQEIDEYKQLKKSLMQLLLTGVARVNELEINNKPQQEQEAQAC